MDDGFNKKAADDNYFTIDLGTESALLGVMDVLTWDKRNNPEEDITELSEYLNNLYSSEDYVLRINAEQFAKIRNAFYHFMNMVEEFPDQEAFELVYPDFRLEDIWEAEDALMNAELEPSSGKGLEDIPTMEKNPEDLKEGEVPVNVKETCPSCGGVNTFSTVDEFGEVRCDECGALDPRDEEWEPNPIAQNPSSKPELEPILFSNCPQCGVDAVNPIYKECENCGWDQDNACPDCFDDRSVTIDEFGSKRCNNCGWAEEPEYPAPTSDTPGVLPPLTDAAKKIKSLEDAFAAPSVEHPLGPHTGAEENTQETYGPEGVEFHNNQHGWSAPAIWSVKITPAEGQREPQSGDIVKSRGNYGNMRTVILTNQLENGTWEFKNSYDNRKSSEEFKQELYASGRFVKDGDRWFVAVQPAAGQREPMSGDLATIQQKSKAFNRPVPVTLVDDMGGVWTFKNGHHPA